MAKVKKDKGKPDKTGAKAQEQPMAQDEDVRGIVRIAGKDVKGHVPMRKALKAVKGVGKRYGEICSRIVSQKLGVDGSVEIGRLSDAQLGEIEEIMVNPFQHGLPSYLLNKRRELATGDDKHLISNDLDFSIKQDIERDIKTRSWRGISHMYRKKVRGQKTRTSGRRSGSVGVVKKKLQPAKGGGKK